MPKDRQGSVADTVRAAVEPIARSLGLSIWDVRYLKEGAQWYLRIFIDKDGGVCINDCEAMSRAVDAPLDELDPISESYILEVSSPGLERELVLDEHFARYINADVLVRMIRPAENGLRDFDGVLESFDKDTVTISDHTGENRITIRKKDAAWIKLDDLDI